MIEHEDRLPDWAWSEEELDKMALDSLLPEKYTEEPTNIVFYHLLKDGERTGLVLIAAVKSVIDGQDAIDRLWVEAGITSIVGECSDESPLNQVKEDALHMVLQKYRYKGKLNLPGSKKVFIYNNWMARLI
jgi:hypothetical protein